MYYCPTVTRNVNDVQRKRRTRVAQMMMCKHTQNTGWGWGLV